MMCPTWLDATDEEVWAMQLVIGGELVDGHGTETDPVLNPASEEVLAEVPSATVEDGFAAVDAARAAGPSWGSATPAVRATALLKLADLLDDNADALARVESANVGKPLGAAAEEMPLCSDHLRFFAGAARVLEGRAAGEYVEGYPPGVLRGGGGGAGGPRGGRVRGGLRLDDRPRAGGRGGPDHAVELPAGNGHLEDRAGAGGGQHDRLEAVGADAADAPAARRAGSAGAAAGRLQRRDRPGQSGGRGDRDPPGGPDGVADRLGAHRQGDRRRGFRTSSG